MPGFREHPLDPVLESMVQSMHNADQQLGKMSENIGEFDAKELTPQEDELIFQHPALRYIGQVHPQTGLPYTNAQAAQQFLQDVGPEEYVNYVQDVVRRMDRRAKEGSPSANTETSLPVAELGTGLGAGQGNASGSSPSGPVSTTSDAVPG